MESFLLHTPSLSKLNENRFSVVNNPPEKFLGHKTNFSTRSHNFFYSLWCNNFSKVLKVN